MLRTVSSGPDTQCDTEQVSSLSWVSVSQTVKGATSTYPPRLRARKGGRQPWQRLRGLHQIAGCSLSGTRIHTASGRNQLVLWSSSPHHPAIAAQGPGSPAAPPPHSRPAPALSRAPPAFRRGCGSRKRRGRYSALLRPDAPQTTPPDSARPPGVPQRRRQGQQPQGRASDTSAQTGRTVRLGTREAMGTWARPAVASHREPRV